MKLLLISDKESEYFAIYRAGGVDIVVTHAPAEGYGEGSDCAHRGFACFTRLMDRWRPRCLVHGHVHMNYAPACPRILYRGETAVINAYERYLLEL